MEFNRVRAEEPSTMDNCERNDCLMTDRNERRMEAEGRNHVFGGDPIVGETPIRQMVSQRQHEANAQRDDFFEIQNYGSSNGPWPNSGSGLERRKKKSGQKNTISVSNGPFLNNSPLKQRSRSFNKSLPSHEEPLLQQRSQRRKRVSAQQNTFSCLQGGDDDIDSGEDRRKRNDVSKNGKLHQIHHQSPLEEATFKTLKVYKRRSGNNIRQRNKEQGIRIMEDGENRISFHSREWVEKLKGTHRGEGGLQTESSSEKEQRGSVGECSKWFDEQPLTAAMAGCLDSPYNVLGLDEIMFGNTKAELIGEKTTEEMASQWVLENIFDIGKAIGLSYGGKVEEIKKLFESIEKRRLGEVWEGISRPREKKGMRELRNLRSEVNYDGRGFGEEGGRDRGARIKGAKRIC